MAKDNSASNMPEAESGCTREISACFGSHRDTSKKMDFSTLPEIIAYMDSYMDEFAVANFNGKQLDGIVTPSYDNTILHIYIMTYQEESTDFLRRKLVISKKKSKNFVQDLLEKFPSLLLKANARGDTPLHVAAANGLLKIVETLIKFAEAQVEDPESGVRVVTKMLGMTNKEGNTALHDAALHGYSDVVEKLIKADPRLSYTANQSGESPLYIAALRGKNDVVRAILSGEWEVDVAYEGPKGKTALHAAVRIDKLDMTISILHNKKQLKEKTDSYGWNPLHCDAYYRWLSKVVMKLLKSEGTTTTSDKNKSLTRKIDDYGWTPLHYAAYYNCSAEVVSVLLEEEGRFAAYIGDNRRGMTPLHLAAAQGHVQILNKIILECPDCYGIVDNRRWNVLHFAMLSLSYEALQSFLKDPLRRSLLYEKDTEGNTPLHVLATSVNVYSCATSTINSNLRSIIIKNGYCFAPNNKNFCPADIVNGISHDESLKEEIEKLLINDEPYTNSVIRNRRNVSEKEIKEIVDAKESHIVVAALVATVTFAAGFTLPGGYNEEGGALLSRKSSFQAFVIIDAIAMVLSVSAMFIYFLISLKTFVKHLFLFYWAFWLTLSSTALMVTAFCTGIYVVLPTWLGIVTCCIGFIFFPLGIYLRIQALKR